jgi:diguanylate cyclase (GGDEF)-like protein/PAS domain S-box-containing protein
MKEFLAKKNASLIRYFAPILTVAIITVTATISVWYLIFESERHSLAQEFAGRARNQTNILQNRIEDYWEKLYAVRALFDSANQPITREEFERFSNSLLAGHSAMLNVAWIPRVTREERVAHEISAVRDGLNNYRIRTITEDNKLVIAPDQDEYYPKFYSTEPRTSRVYGLDNNDGGARLRAVHHIRDENVLSTSPPLMLLIGEGDRRGFWAGLPVYARGLPHETVEDRRRNFIGFIQGVFQIRVLIDTVLAGLNTPVRLYLFAPNAGADDLPVYYSSRLNRGPIAASSQTELTAGMHQSFALNFGDVPWTLIVTPEPAGLASSGHDRSSIILISGLLLSGLLTSFMWASRRQAGKLASANDNYVKQNLRFDAALNNMAQGLLMYDRAGRLIVFNRRFTELFGVPWEKWEPTALGMTVPQSMQLAHDLTNIAEKNQTQIIAELQNILDRRTAGRIIVERTDGRTFSAFCAPMSDGGFVVTFDDITEQRRTQEQISHMAHYDSLTNLPNRVLFYEKMESILARTSQNKGFAVFSLDLDHFKSVNDTLGHPVGDQLLQAAAKRMHSCVRENDIVARLGGDEFAIVLTRFDQPADATSLAKRLIETVSAPYQLGDHQVMVGTSIGIAIAPGDGAEPDLLMKNADLALYRCKADGGNTYRFFEPQMDARMQVRRALELDLRKALVNGEFTLDYQPIVNLKTGRVSTCEALIRWHHPERGLVPPLEFIPIAEETGLIVPIGEWVLRRACADAAEWPGEFTVAVNVSPAQFKSSQLVNTVMKALETSHLPASRLELEITELVLMQDNNTVLDTLHQLRDLGVSIAMDDFGTGYSSLSYLRSFPFDKIKIDQSFIEDLAGNKDSLAILRAVVGIGRSLGIVTTAEGIESQNQLEVLRTEGCTEAQGFFFSRPKSAGDIKDFLCQLDRPARAIA